MSKIQDEFRQSKGSISSMTIEMAREKFSEAFGGFEILPGTTVEKTKIGDMNAEWITAAGVPVSKQVILFFHGGGMAVGSCDDYRHFASRISSACGTRVLIPEYRLAPEHRYPAANEDGLAAYHWLIKQGIPAEEIVICGDSAGGALASMTLLSLRDSGDPLPSGLILISAVLDKIYFDGESYTTKADSDPLESRESCKMWADLYCPLNPKPAIMSPINCNLEGLPSMLIQVGENEVLLSDSTRMAERAKFAGIDVTLEVWPGMYHDFPMFAQNEPDGRKALEHIGNFVKKHFA